MNEMRIHYGDNAHFNVNVWHDDPGMVMLDTGDIPEFKLTPREADELAAALLTAARWARGSGSAV